MISKFQDMYINVLNLYIYIYIYIYNSIYNFFFKKMVDSQNEAMVLITLIHVYKIAPKVIKI
jgi:hypothetical protein